MLPAGLSVGIYQSASPALRHAAHRSGKTTVHAQTQRCLAAVIAAILSVDVIAAALPVYRAVVRKEAVFSSCEDRIRARNGSIAVAGSSIVPRLEASTRQSSIANVSPHNWFTRAAESLFTVFFPGDCRICGMPLLNISRLPVCPECLEQIHPVEDHVCSICGERVFSNYAENDVDGMLRCPVCRRIERPFTRSAAYGSYDGGLRELIHLLKFNGVRPAAKVLGRMLAEAVSTLELAFGESKIAVIPVPLYKTRFRQRGFNQAELIARAALRFLPQERMQLVSGVLLRTRDTHSQIGLTSHQRRENIRGAFAVTRAKEVIGREVLLVDDVYTTGTTLSECARVVHRAGAAQVWVATVARTFKNPSFNISRMENFTEDLASA
jgi:ComF family protein